MAQVTTHLIVAQDAEALLSSIRALPAHERPLYVGQTHHWIHAPHEISVKALLGDGSHVTKWDYLLTFRTPPTTADPLALPSTLEKLIKHKWSLTATADPAALDALPVERKRRLTSTPPPLPAGWSPSDHSALDAAIPPEDLEVSLALNSHRLGADRANDRPVILKSYLRAFGTTHPGPILMQNFDSSHPGQRPRFFNYIETFSASVGIKYGGEPAIFSQDPTDWSSRAEEGEITVQEAQDSGTYGVEGGTKVGWEDVALVWYPSIWHFAAMLDDPAYAQADREFKGGVLRDGPLILTTEVEV